MKYHGITSVLSEAQSANGENYPFAYHPKIPEAKSWSYRLLSPEGASPLTVEALTTAIQQSPFRFLMADWHGYEGYPLAVIEIHLPPPKPGESGEASKTGDSGGSSGPITVPQQVRIEKGPELNMEQSMPKPSPSTQTLERRPPPPPPRPPKKIEIEGPDIGMSF